MLLFPYFNYSLVFFDSEVIAQLFNPIAELLIPVGTTTKEAKAEI